MQCFNMRKAIGLFMALAFFIGGTQTVLAVGTASGTVITNDATVNYDVGGSARSASGSVNFTVDNRVDLTVVNQDAGNNVDVTPGSTDQPMQFLVTNDGNTTQGYLLSTATGTTNIPMGNVRIYIDNGNNSWDGTGTETLYVAGTSGFDLAADASRTVYIVADTPAAAVNTNQDDYRLIASTTASGNVGSPASILTASGSPTAGVDIVFADTAGPSDGNRDAQFSATATYTVTSAALSVSKTIDTTVDEFGTNFAIPGAHVIYRIAVTNNGSTSPTTDTVSVTDQIPTGTQICVSTTGNCTAPVFSDGSTSSGLSLNAFEYSSDVTATPCEPGDFTYTPTADGNGFDAAVTCVRATTTGDMNGSGGFFEIQLNVGIQ